MCGILGSINHPFDHTHLDLIKHRGPDDSGFETFQINHNEVRFAHRRLSILDLTNAGHQPMLSQCGKCVIIFNGEIYNHLELRKELSNQISFKGHSDTETILYYLRDQGIEAVKNFNGIFAFAFLDLRDGTLTLARDPFGVKPLYYHADDQTLIFASEIRPVKKLIEKACLDKQALATLLRLRFNPSPDTLHRGIQKLRPGHYLKFHLLNENLQTTVKSYIAPYPKRKPIVFNDAVTVYGQQLEQAVKRQLLSDVDVGILLSGGVDSAVVAALAARNYSGRLKAFTVGFEGNHREDEIEDAAETALVLGLEHHVKQITFTDFLSQLEKCVAIVEEPVATTSILPMYYLAELACQHVKVVLTGQGADEPLGGYKKYRFEAWRQFLAAPIANGIASFLQILNSKNESIRRAANSVGIQSEALRFINIAEVFDDKEIFDLTGIRDTQTLPLLHYLHDSLGFYQGMSSAEKMMAIDARFNLADDLLNYTDKISMHYSIECRVPMLDQELVSFTQSLPLKHKLTAKHQKRVHKAYAEKLLPRHIVHRPKRGFQSPTRFWFARESDTIKDILLTSGSSFAEVFKQSTIAEIINAHKAGYNREKQIFLLLSIYYWMHQNT